MGYRLGHCHFCLAPKGLTSYSSRLFESIFAGCIPVILSDRLRLPFSQIIPWDQIAIRWPEGEISKLYPFLVDQLANNASGVVQMRDALAKYECWLDYGQESECSPYRAILRTLAQRHREDSYSGWRPKRQDSF